MSDRDPAVQALLDKKAIEETLVLFLRGCDRADMALVERAYWPDGWEDHGGTFDGPAADWVEAIRGRLSGAGLMNHLMTNLMVELTGPASAIAESYVLTASRVEKDGQRFDSRTLARCVDRMEKRGDEWRILRRALRWEWNEEREIAETWARGSITDDPSRLLRGARKPDDILYQL